jgi:hypothetical protein
MSPRKRYADDVLACWVYWEALRRIGFASDDIYISVYHEIALGFEVCGVELRTQKRVFIINAAALTRSRGAFRNDWLAFCEDVLAKRIDTSTLEARWAKRPAEIGQLPGALVLKGFILPPIKEDHDVISKRSN